jgi:DNA-binding PucR family transcriptional regulator
MSEESIPEIIAAAFREQREKQRTKDAKIARDFANEWFRHAHTDAAIAFKAAAAAEIAAAIEAGGAGD